MSYEKELKTFLDYLIRKRLRESTIETYKNVVSKFLELIKKNPENITKSDIDKYEGSCVKYQNNSLANRYSAVNKYLHFLIDKEILEEKAKKWILKPPKKKAVIKHPMTTKQVEKLFEVSKRNPRDRAIFMTLYYGMLRRSELIALNIDNVDFKKKTVDVLDAKGGVDATINLTQRCIDAISEYKKNYREKPREGHDGALFLNDGRRLSRTKLHELHKEYKVRAGLPDKFRFYPHLWRTTGITHYAQTEKDPKTLQSQTRHRDINVLYDRYVKKTDQELRKSYDKAFESIPNDSIESIANKKIDEPEVPKTKKKDDSTDNYIAKPNIEPKVHLIQQSNLIELEMKLIEQLANGEISNKIYSDAMTRLENINKNHNGNAVGYQ